MRPIYLTIEIFNTCEFVVLLLHEVGITLNRAKLKLKNINTIKHIV